MTQKEVQFHTFKNEPVEFSIWVKTYLKGTLEEKDIFHDNPFLDIARDNLEVGLASIKLNDVESYYIQLYNTLDSLIIKYAKASHTSLIDTVVGIHQTLVAKNIDYGNSFDKAVNRFGLTGAVIRVYDKLNRLVNLEGDNGEVADEAPLDTMMDLIGYSLLTLHHYQNLDKVGDNIG